MKKLLLTSTCIGALSIWAALATNTAALAQDTSTSPQRTEQPGSQTKETHPAVKKPAEPMNRSATGRSDEAAPRPNSSAQKNGEPQHDKMRSGDATRENPSKPETRAGERSQERPKERVETTTGAATTTSGATGTSGRDEIARHDRFRLDQRQASDLRGRLEKRRDVETGPADFTIRRGAAIPETVRLQEVPPDIIAEYPQFRDYDFMVARDEVVIVDPRTREIVEVVGNDEGAPAMRGARLHFSPDQDELIRRNIQADRTRAIDFDERSDDRVPDTVVLEPLPDMIVADIPDVRSYRYFVDRDGHIVIVDPESHEVVDIVD